MPKYEYKTVVYNARRVPLPPTYGTPGVEDPQQNRSKIERDPPADYLNTFGEDGWELVQIILYSDAALIYFKRVME